MKSLFIFLREKLSLKSENDGFCSLNAIFQPRNLNILSIKYIIRILNQQQSTDSNKKYAYVANLDMI